MQKLSDLGFLFLVLGSCKDLATGSTRAFESLCAAQDFSYVGLGVQLRLMLPNKPPLSNISNNTQGLDLMA